MKAVILAGGEGTRLRPLTYYMPKSMVPVGDKPLLHHQIRGLSPYVDGFVLVVGYKKEEIQRYFGDGSAFDTDIEYVLQEKPRGTADAFGKAEGHVDKKFIAMNGDIIFDFKFVKDLLAKDWCMGVREVAEPWRFGVIDPGEGHIQRIVEKPEQGKEPSKLACMGVNVFQDKIFDFIHKTPLSKRGELEITDSLQLAIDSGVKIDYEIYKGEWVDIGNFESLKKAREIFG